MVQSRCDSAAALDMLHQQHQPKGKAFEIDEHDLQALAQPQHLQQQPQQQHSDPHHSHQRMCLNPAEIYGHVAEGGEAKHRNSWLKEVILGILAGAFIGFGFATCMIAAGQVREAQRSCRFEACSAVANGSFLAAAASSRRHLCWDAR